MRWTLFKKICWFGVVFIVTATSVQADRWNIRSEALFFQAREKGLAFVNEPADILTTNNFTCKPLKHPHFGWDWGFRAGVGYQPCGWHWEFNFTWTHFDTRQSTWAHADELSGMFPVFSLKPDIMASDYVTDAHLRWKLRLNLFDIDVRDTICFYDNFAFQWQVGFRIPWIRQKYNFDYFGGIFADEGEKNKQHNDYLGAGPHIGFELSFMVWDDFSLYGSLAGAIVFGSFDIQHSKEYLEYTRFNRHNDFYRTTVNSDLAAGVRWTSSGCRFPVTVSVGWEQHVFYNMNRLKRGEFHFFSERHNLTLQGLVIAAAAFF